MFILGWFCDICDVKFHYKSKYKRHLQTVSHKRRASILSINYDEPDVSSPSHPLSCNDNQDMLQRVDSREEMDSIVMDRVEVVYK